jgi:hypothetical protein
MFRVFRVYEKSEAAIADDDLARRDRRPAARPVS